MPAIGPRGILEREDLRPIRNEGGMVVARTVILNELRLR